MIYIPRNCITNRFVQHIFFCAATFLFCCGCSTSPLIPIPAQQPTETPAFSWTWPAGEALNINPELSELFDSVINYYRSTWPLAQNECILPSIKVFAKIDDTGEYYAAIETMNLSCKDEKPSTLEIGTGGGYFKIDTADSDSGKVVTNITRLSLDGNYEYTKEQLDKVPGLFDAYDNKNLVPLTYIEETPSLATLVHEYISEYNFSYVDVGDGELQTFEKWLDSLI